MRLPQIHYLFLELNAVFGSITLSSIFSLDMNHVAVYLNLYFCCDRSLQLQTMSNPTFQIHIEIFFD